MRESGRLARKGTKTSVMSVTYMQAVVLFERRPGAKHRDIRRRLGRLEVRLAAARRQIVGESDSSRQGRRGLARTLEGTSVVRARRFER